jgi:hypothetical protein
MSAQEIRELALNDLYLFARLVNPHRVYGECHKKLFSWWMSQETEGNSHTLVLWPRDHQKSHCAAVYAAWCITRDPAVTILYVSATAALAEKQLKAIKDILTSDKHRLYWPDMINQDEGKREKWTTTEICVDHPKRRQEGVRDSTVFAAGLTTNVTGFHASHVFLDDIVVPGNAYTNEGRSKVQALYSQLASVETTGAKETCVGTRYHPLDIYKDMMEMHEPEFDENDEVIGKRQVYAVSIEVVERQGVFLWPKEYRAHDGKPFGFDARELGRKQAKYMDKTQFYAQYYQEPNDPESHRLNYEKFQYYPREQLKVTSGGTQYRGEYLNVYASIDFAYSTAKKADFSAIVVIGVASNGHVFLLDIDRFKTNNIDGYYQHVLDMHAKWHFKKLRAEITAAQVIIVRDLKDRASQEGLPLIIEDNSPTRHNGSKEERIAAVLEPRYMNGTIWHFRGGYTPMLEEELVLARPPHDDIKDALAAAVEFSRPPMKARVQETAPARQFHPRFGGVTR